MVLAAKRVATIIITIPPAISEDIKVNIHEINIASAPDTPVLLRGDRAIEYGHIVRIMTVLQQAGAQSVGLVSESP